MNRVPPSAYSHSDADVLNQSLLEANTATEVCLTVLDTLSVFIMSFKVRWPDPPLPGRILAALTSWDSLLNCFDSSPLTRRRSCAWTRVTAR